MWSRKSFLHYQPGSQGDTIPIMQHSKCVPVVRKSTMGKDFMSSSPASGPNKYYTPNQIGKK